MSVTSYKFAGTVANVDRDGTSDWSSPDNAKADDNIRTSNAVIKAYYSDWLRLTNFGFTSSDIPTGSTIDGIQVVIDRYVTETSPGSGYMIDSALYLRKTSGQVGSNYASATYWPASETNATYGGAIDKWGTTWVIASITSNDFGIDLSAYYIGLILAYAYIDYIKIRVYYTLPPWLHKFMGISYTNISKINGISMANIQKINDID